MFSEVVLGSSLGGITSLRTTDAKRPTISSDAISCNILFDFLFFLFHSFEWKVGLSFR